MCFKCLPQNAVSNDYLDGLPPIFADAMRQLHSGKITPADLHGELLNHIAQELWRGVEIGFDTAADFDPNTFNFINDIEENLYVFSGFKVYHQLREASLLMYDATGQFKPFTQFMKDVQNINSTYNITYLKTEYDNAVTSATMAAKWEQFGNESTLKFVATLDDHTTVICHSLNGLTKPKSWPGWKKWYLPLHWNERSTIIETFDEISDIHESDLPEPKGMFGGNVALDGVIFPDTHPYITKVDKATSDTIRKNAKGVMNDAAHYDTLAYSKDIQDSIKAISQRTLPKAYDALSDLEKGALHLYTNHGYRKLNKYLFTEGAEYVKDADMLQAFEFVLNNALDKLKTPHQPVVYRGVRELPVELLENYKSAFENGTTLTHKAFTSTSYEKGFGGAIRYRILNKTGTMIEHISEFEGESEVLFKSNTQFKVTGFERTEKAIFIEMEEII